MRPHEAPLAPTASLTTVPRVLVIDYDSTEWPYEQLHRQLRDGIMCGQWPVGRSIPSIVTIRQETGADPGTIRKVFRLLQAEGLVQIIKGKGTYVISKTPRPPGQG